jgi:hypothetical protein
MDKKPLIVGSIVAVVLVVLSSLSNVVGYQTVQTSNQNNIHNEVNQRELLFQTIVDIANDNEIQRVILNSHMYREGFFNRDVKFPVSDIPVLTTNQLTHLYFIGLLLSKIISPSRIHSIVGKYQVNNQEMELEITTVIEKNPALKGEITQLQNSKCDCENKKTSSWSFPVICTILYLCILALDVTLFLIYRITGMYFVQIHDKLVGIIGVFATFLSCPWI